MDVTIQIMIAVIVGYLIWVIFGFVQKIRVHCLISRRFPVLEPCHPILGHVPIFADLATFTDTIIEMVGRTKTKLVPVWIFFRPLYEAVHPDTVRDILKISEPKPKGFAQSYSTLLDMIGDGLLVSDGKKWERNRKLLTPAFHFDVLRPYVKIYNEAAEILLKKFANQIGDTSESINITESLSLLSLDVMLRCSLSYEGHVQEDDHHPYAVASKEIGILYMDRLRTPWNSIWWLYMLTEKGRRFRRHANYMKSFATELITKRRKAVGDDPSMLNKRRLDFLDIMITARDENGVGLTDQDILDETRTFLFEGHDTTASALNWHMYCLAKYPEEQEKVYTEVCSLLKDREDVEWEDISKLSRMSVFIKESMRMFSPVGGGHRVLTKPMEFDGVTLPVGAVVSISAHLLHHNPEVYPDHMEFRPERFLEENYRERDPFSYIPFLAGPRNCIGQVFTLNEQKVVLARILKRYKIILDPDHEVVLVPEITNRPKYGIKVRLEPR